MTKYFPARCRRSVRCGLRLAPALAALWWAVAAFAQAPPLVVAVPPYLASLPIHVAEARGHFAAEGVTLRTVDCTSSRSCLQQVFDGRADLAAVAELFVTVAGFEGADVAIIGALSTSSRRLKLVARRAAGISAPHDLRGKRVGTVGGSAAQYFLERWLLVNDVDASQVGIVPLAPEQLVGALQRGDVQAVAIWEPIAGSAVSALAADAVVLPGPSVYKQHFVLAAARPTISRRDADLQRLLRALERATRVIREQPDAARAVLRSRLNADAESAAAALTDHEYRLALEQSLASTMDSQLRWLQRAAQPAASGAPVQLLRMIDPAPLSGAVPGAVTLLVN